MPPPNRPGRRLAALLWRPFRALLLGALLVVIFVEEWGWRPLTALAAAIRRAPAPLALALFLVPALLLVPVKVVALWLIQEGRATLGVGVIVAAKVVGTAVVGRLFLLVEPQLMSFAWFARCLGWWRATRDRALAALRESRLWRSGQALARAARRGLRRLRMTEKD